MQPREEEKNTINARRSKNEKSSGKSAEASNENTAVVGGFSAFKNHNPYYCIFSGDAGLFRNALAMAVCMSTRSSPYRGLFVSIHPFSCSRVSISSISGTVLRSIDAHS